MSTSPTVEEFHLIGDIYDAAVDGGFWPRVMAEVARLCGADKIMMPVTDILNPASNLAISHNIPAAAIETWRREGHAARELDIHGRWLARVGPCIPSNSDDEFGGPEGYRRVAGSYYDMLERNHVRRQMGALLESGDYRFAAIGLNNYDPFPPHAAPTLGRLAPHLRRALEIHRQLCIVKGENNHLYRMLDGLATGIVLLDGNEHIRYANPHAASQLRQHGGTGIQRERLLVRDVKQNAMLHALIEGAVRTSQREGLGESGGVIGLPSPDGGNALTLSVAPLSSLTAWQELRSDKIAAALFITEANSRHQLAEKALHDLYRLTPREIAVCHAFLNTPELESLAPQLGLTLGSLRTIMKAIYQKTGQPSQAKLMRLLMEMKLDFRHL